MKTTHTILLLLSLLFFSCVPESTTPAKPDQAEEEVDNPANPNNPNPQVPQNPIPPAGPLPVLPPNNTDWTSFPVLSGAKVVYVSSSLGDNINSGLTENDPVQTIGKGYSLIRDGFPDQLLLKRGDTFSSGLGVEKGGPTSNEKLLYSNYGDPALPRPIIKNKSFGLRANNIAIVGIHFSGPGKTNNPTGEGLDTPHNVTFSHIHLEDLLIEGHKTGLRFRMANDVVFRRSVLADSQINGIYTSQNKRVLIEENVFSNNGTSETRDHNIYMSKSEDFTIRYNIFHKGGNFGTKLRPPNLNLIVHDNLYVNNRNSLSFALDNEDAFDRGHPEYKSVNVTMTKNVFTKTGKNGQQYNIFLQHVANILIKDNIFTDTPRTENNKRLYGAVFVMQSTVEDPNIATNLVDVQFIDNIISNTGNEGIRLGTLNYLGVEVSNNVIDIANDTEVFKMGKQPKNNLPELTLANNFYNSARTPSKWFEWPGGTFYNYDQWIALTGETNPTKGAPNFKNKNVTIESYNQSVGGQATLADFISEAKLQSKYYWRDTYNAQKVNEYFRDGFQVVP